jgi:hypothetical protein
MPVYMKLACDQCEESSDLLLIEVLQRRRGGGFSKRRLCYGCLGGRYAELVRELRALAGVDCYEARCHHCNAPIDDQFKRTLTAAAYIIESMTRKATK